MSLSFSASSLISRVVRVNFSNGKSGSDLLGAVGTLLTKPRKIANLTKLTGQQGQGGIIGWIWNKAASFVGWAVPQLLGFIRFSAVAIWQLFWTGVQSLWRFDWNASDQALKQMVGDQNLLLAQVWGGFVGQGIGYLAGLAVGYGISFLCPVIGGAALARAVTAAAAKEVIDDLGVSLRIALQQTAKSLAMQGLVSGYVNFRRWLKNADFDTLVKVFGREMATFIKFFWGNEGGPRMSGAASLERTIDRIPNKYVKAFLEEMLEESWDSFMEAGLIVMSEIDQAYAQSKLENQATLGTARTVEILPDKEAPSEKLTFVNVPQKLLMPTVQTAINTHRMVYNRDIGLVMGMPVEEYTRAKPQSLRLVIDLYSVKSPPFFRQTGPGFTWATITIPDVKRSALDWNKIKAALGGPNGYLWGRFRATVQLDTGRRLVLHAGSEQEAEKRVMALLELSNAELKSLNITEEKKAGERAQGKRLYKETTRVYPAFFTIINREKVLDPTKGNASLQGNYRDAKAKIPLWMPREPWDANDKIRRILRIGI